MLEPTLPHGPCRDKTDSGDLASVKPPKTTGDHENTKVNGGDYNEVSVVSRSIVEKL